MADDYQETKGLTMPRAHQDPPERGNCAVPVAHPRAAFAIARSAVAAAAGIALAFTVAGVASAVTVDSGAERGVDDPRVVVEVDAPAAWEAAVTRSTGDLPGDVRFPESAPAFFSGDPDTTNEGFDPRLFDHFVRLYAQCAWLDTKVDAVGSGDSATAEKASEAIRINAERLEDDWDGGYANHVLEAEQAAEERNLSAEEMLLVWDCAGLYETEKS